MNDIEKQTQAVVGSESPLTRMDTYEEHMRKMESEKAGLNANNNIYREIARDALINWNGLSVEEANEKVKSSSVEELESQVGARGSIEAAVEGILGRLSKYTDVDQGEVLDAVFNQDKNSDAMASLKTELGKVSAEKIEDFTLDILSDIHNRWIENNFHKFFDEKRADRLYQFMPLEAIGYKEATADLLFLKPILESAGIKINDEKLKSAYEKRSEEFMDKAISQQYVGDTHHDHVIGKIAEESRQLDMIMEPLSKDISVDEAILSQLKDHNPAVKKVLENWGYGEYENVTDSIGRVGTLENGIEELNKMAESLGHPVVMVFNGRPLKSGTTVDDFQHNRR